MTEEERRKARAVAKMRGIAPRMGFRAGRLSGGDLRQLRDQAIRARAASVGTIFAARRPRTLVVGDIVATAIATGAVVGAGYLAGRYWRRKRQGLSGNPYLIGAAVLGGT
jgi:uncharacterized protein YciW